MNTAMESMKAILLVGVAAVWLGFRLIAAWPQPG
jgi:hypothetical protein